MTFYIPLKHDSWDCPRFQAAWQDAFRNSYQDLRSSYTLGTLTEEYALFPDFLSNECTCEAVRQWRALIDRILMVNPELPSTLIADTNSRLQNELYSELLPSLKSEVILLAALTEEVPAYEMDRVLNEFFIDYYEDLRSIHRMVKSHPKKWYESSCCMIL